jgi:SAM-dependent methyltransferase
MNSSKAYWWALRALGLKRASWDRQFEAHIWDRGPRSPVTTELVVDLCHGRLVEFGCGEGTLPAVLPAGTFTEYVGYDISRVAVDRARAKGLLYCRFEQCDMAGWPGGSASLFLFEECLYYLTRQQITDLLGRCEGCVLVVVHSTTRHASTLDACRRARKVQREFTVGERGYLMLC